jgi:SOS response regulatory protein OraA/RecX
LLKSKKIKGDNEFKRHQKLVKFVMQKGFQSDLAWKVLRNEL